LELGKLEWRGEALGRRKGVQKDESGRTTEIQNTVEASRWKFDH